MIPATTFAGKTAAVFGLGASGVATARALLAGGAAVAAWDDSEASRAAAEQAGVPLADLRHADWSKLAALVLAPGVPLTHPEPHWTVKAAKAAGVEVIGDIELFCRELALLTGGGAGIHDAPFIAVTGTNGKSTTTALIAHILRTAGLDVQMGGNIGTPILALEPPKASNVTAGRRFHVIECSSFQIDLAPSLRPLIGVLLNVTPDHLDRHGTMETYAALKERLIGDASHAVIGVDDGICRGIYERRRARCDGAGDGVRPIPVSGVSVPEAGFGPRGSAIGYSENGEFRALADLAGTGSLRGAHNRQNAAAAAAVARALGAPPEDVWRRGLAKACLQPWLETFPGLPHRMEEIGGIGRVLFINDSKATNADSTEKALLSWERDIFWIAGGKPKEGGIASLAPLFPRVAKAYLIGEAAEDFAATLDGKAAFERSGALDSAIASAARDAARSGGAEPVVLLSPACASYDQFKNFEARGEAFRKIVAELPGLEPRAGGKSAP